MAKSLKNYPVVNGMSERGTRVDTPFKYLENLQRVKNSLRVRPPYVTLGQGPDNWQIWETLEIDENFYEVFVTLDRDLFVFKNGAEMLHSTVWSWTGGPIQASVLGNVVAIWDPAQVVEMATPAANPYPNEGFLIVKSPVDYLSKVVIQSPQGTIQVSIGDPTVDGHAKTDSARAVEAVARKIAQGFGGGWKNVGEVGQAALDNAQTAFDALPNTYTKNQPAWDALKQAIATFNEADAAVQGVATPEQRTMLHDYWSDLVPSVLAEMAAINVSTVPGYVSGTDYSTQANIDTLGASTQKTQLSALRAKADGYLAKAAAALIPVDEAAAAATRTIASNALLTVMTLYGNTDWALSADPTNLNPSFSEVMLWSALNAISVAAAGTSTAGRFLYKGNVVYIPDTTGISIVQGEEYLTLIAGSVLGPADLPRYAPVGTFLKVNPVPSTLNITSGAVMYLKAVPLLTSTPSGMSEVTWEECCLNTEPKDLIASTMPVIVDLIPSAHAWNTPTDTFNYWVPRKAGDYKLCPQPLLIGNRITDIGRGANRLLLLSDNSTITSSELGRRANIFRVSALQLFPTDAISTAISGEKPSHLYKIIPWGMHIALLGTSSIFKFDVSQGIDATMLKISRACSWNGPKAIACPTGADLLLVSPVGIHVLSYGVYGTRVELENLTEGIDLPDANCISAFYDPLRKTLYALYSDRILVGWDLGKTWGWGWYTSPSYGISTGWMVNNNLRLVTGTNNLITLALHDSTSIDENWPSNTEADVIEQFVPWTMSTGLNYPTDRPSVATYPGTEFLHYGPPIRGRMLLQGADSLNLGWIRLSKVLFSVRGPTSLTYLGAEYLNTQTYSRSHHIKGSEAPPPITYSIAIPLSSFSNSYNTDYLDLNYGEINLCTLSYYSRSTNTAPGG